MILLVWKFAQMHQNTFLNTPDGQKYIFWKKSFWLSGSMCKCIKTRFWWFLSMCKCIKTRFYPFQTVKNIFFEKSFLVFSKYAQMHQNTFLTTSYSKKYYFLTKKFPDSRRSKISFLQKKVSGGLEVCANASKHVFKHSLRSKKSFLKKCFWWSGNVRRFNT